MRDDDDAVQAEQFETTLAALETTTHFGWVLVLRFYVALHYVEAVLQKKRSARRRSHESRRDDMWRVPESAADNGRGEAETLIVVSP